MSGAVVIMTCDLYSPFWAGMYHYMRLHWDAAIDWPIYFCTEEMAPPDQSFHHLAVGKGPFHERHIRILKALEKYDHIFFMLEEYWPIKLMTKEMFDGLYGMFVKNNWDCLHIDSVRPDIYKLKPTEHTFLDRRIWQFQNDSDWFFNQQAAFWKRDLMLKCVVPPTISEVEARSSITVELTCDAYMRQKYPDSKVMLYHYYWYPRGGVVNHGNISEYGRELGFQMNIDNWCKANEKPQLLG